VTSPLRELPEPGSADALAVALLAGGAMHALAGAPHLPLVVATRLAASRFLLWLYACEAVAAASAAGGSR
jgi:hypothetical protein